MAIVLHPNVFRRLACWKPAAVRDTGGIVIPTLLLLRDYACHLTGLEPTSAALIHMPGPPSRSLAFGEVEGVSSTDETLTQVRVSGMDPFWIYHRPGHAVRLRLVLEAGAPDLEYLNMEEDAKIQRAVSGHLSHMDMMFLVPYDGDDYIPDVDEK
jgi:hypothetical protein